MTTLSSVAKRIVKSTLASAAGWRLAGSLRKPGASVITYHRIGKPQDPFPSLAVTSFRQQMLWLRRHCTVIMPEELQDRAQGPTGLRPPVLVTFDDGYRDYHDNAYPILKELEIPALVFLSTSFMDHGGLMWSDVLHLGARACTRKKVSLPWASTGCFELPRDHRAFLDAARAHLKEIPHLERDPTLARLLDALGVHEDDLRVDRQMLSWDEVRATADLTRFGGHTHTHAILSRLNPRGLEEEIGTCRDRIRAETTQSSRYFAYPNGREGDFTEEAKHVLRRHGFELAFTTSAGINGSDTDWMEIRRIAGPRSVDDLVWSLVRSSWDSGRSMKDSPA